MSAIRSAFRSDLRRGLAVRICIFFAAWIPRVLALDAFVTVDEPKWLNRSGNFLAALTNLDWSTTFQKEHPGVTIQWLGLLGYLTRFPAYAEWAGGAITDVVLEARLWEDGLMPALDLLVAGRWWVTVAVALIVTALFGPLRRLFGLLPALAAVLFLAWSPYFVALSRQLHPDGLLAALSLLALLLWLVWLYDGRQSRDLAGAGVILGLALLTKTTAAFVAVTGGVLLLAELVRLRRAGRQPLWTLLGGGLAWGGLAALTFTLLWPAMWTDAPAVLLKITAQMQQYQAEVHSLPTYFRGQVVHDDPGTLFYPYVILWRLSPVTMLGLLPALWFGVRKKYPFADSPADRAIFGILLFVVLTVVGMSVGAKKIDRYMLPAILALEIPAALGWTGLAAALSDRSGAPRRWVAPTAVAGLVLLHGLFTVRHYPYYLTYVNPLLGGTRVAPQVMMLGWGEGLDQVGAWLTANGAPEDPARPLSVVSWYDDGPLSYYLPGDVRHTDFIDTDTYWFDADYAVLYVNQWQRENPEPDVINHFLAREPVFTVTANGLDLAKVYDLRGSTPPPFTQIHLSPLDRIQGLPQSARLEPLHLDAYRLESTSALPGETVDVELFLRVNEAPGRDIEVQLDLQDPAGRSIWQERRHPAGVRTSDWRPQTVYKDPYRVEIPADAAPGVYELDLTIIDQDNVQSAAIVRPVATLLVQTPATQTLTADWGVVGLTSIRHAPAVAPGRTLIVDLTATGNFANTKLSLRLVDEDGKSWAQVDKELAEDLRFELNLPVDAPPGVYTISAVVYSGDTGAPLLDQQTQSPTSLSAVQVAAREVR